MMPAQNDTDGSSPPTENVNRSHLAARILMAIVALFVVMFVVSMVPWTSPMLSCFAAPFAAIGVTMLDQWLVQESWYSRRPLLGRSGLLAATAAIALSAFLWLVTGREQEAFNVVFARVPTTNIQNLTGQRSYAGLFDRDDILLRFKTDKATLNDLVGDGGYARDDATVQAYKEGKITWTGFCDKALLNPHSRFGRWGPARPMVAPVLYRRTEKHDIGSSSFEYDVAAILWDSKTGEAFVHRRGGN